MPGTASRLKPTFLILGAAKCGTTALWYYLKQHPDICMSDPKEPFFFEAEYEKGYDYYIQTYFKDLKDQHEAGEARHRNLFLPYVPERIKATLPDAKFIVLVRNPIERAFSQYLHEVSYGSESLSFEDALENNIQRLQSGPLFFSENEIKCYIQSMDKRGHNSFRTYLDSGYYADQIDRYVKLFGRDRIKIILQEDLLNHTRSILEDVFDYLGVRKVLISDLTPSNKAVSSLGIRIYKLFQEIHIKNWIPESISRRVRKLFEVKKPEMSSSARKWLLEHYSPHNKKLEILMGRNLSHWT